MKASLLDKIQARNSENEERNQKSLELIQKEENAFF